MKKKILTALAYDPSEGSVSNLGGFAKFAKRFDLEVLPLSIFLDQESAFVGSDAEKSEKIRKRILGKLRKFRNFVAPSVILQRGGSRNLAAEVFLRKADEVSAEIIAMDSHGRSGISRWVLGSFAESILNQSSKPLLFLPKAWPKESARKKQILFPTDFSEKSSQAFQSMLQLFSGRGITIQLYHAILFPTPVASLEVPPSSFVPDSYFQDQRKWAESQASAWKSRAKDLGFEIEFLLEEKGMGFLSGALVMEVARKLKVDMIGISSQSGAFDRFLAGSSAFDLFRKKRLPVWVFGPNCKRTR